VVLSVDADALSVVLNSLVFQEWDFRRKNGEWFESVHVAGAKRRRLDFKRIKGLPRVQEPRARLFQVKSYY